MHEQKRVLPSVAASGTPVAAALRGWSRRVAWSTWLVLGHRRSGRRPRFVDLQMQVDMVELRTETSGYERCMAHSIEWESLRGPPTPRVTERRHPCAPDSLAQDAPARRPHLGHDLRPLHNWRANRAPLEPTSRLTNRHRGRHGPGAAATAPPTLCLWVNRFSVVQSLDRPAGERHTKCRTAGLHPRVGLAKRGPGGALARGAEKENDGSNP